MESKEETHIAILVLANFEFIENASEYFDRILHLEKIQQNEFAIRFLECQKLFSHYKPPFWGLLATSDQRLIEKYKEAISFDNLHQLLTGNLNKEQNVHSDIVALLNTDSFPVIDEVQKIANNDGLFSAYHDSNYQGSVFNKEGLVHFEELCYNRKFFFYDSPIVYHTLREARSIEPNMFGLHTLINCSPYNLSVEGFNHFFDINILKFEEEFDYERMSYNHDNWHNGQAYYRHFNKKNKVRLYIHRTAAELIVENIDGDIVINVETVIDSNGYFEYYVNGIFDKKRWEFTLEPIVFWK